MVSKVSVFGSIALLVMTVAKADPVTAPDGTDAFFVLGWASAGDELCKLKTHRIFLALAKSKGLTDAEIVRNMDKINRATEQARQDQSKIGLAEWCKRYERGVLTGNPSE